MNVNKIANKVKHNTSSSKSTFPKVKIDGFYEAVKNTDKL